MLEFIPGPLRSSLFGFIVRWPWLHKKLNGLAINSIVNWSRRRPHPWSTFRDYVSWTGLTDQTYSARHLPAVHRAGLPEPKALAELFRRQPGKQRLSSKSTCLFPAFAQYLTDGFIRTVMPNESAGEPFALRLRNTSNHQIDLCTLYGRLQEQTAQLRVKSEEPGQRGRLKSQLINGEEFSPFLYDNQGKPKPEFDRIEEPLGKDKFLRDSGRRDVIFAVGGDRVNSAPHVVMMNTLWLREHNRLAGVLATTYRDWDDERVFQTARNAVIVMFIKIVVEEYINHISPEEFPLIADPTVAWTAPWNKPNWITAEFSLLYRWHSLIPNTITWNGHSVPVEETFFDNRFLLSASLAESFAGLSAQKAGELGAFNTADALVAVEQRAIDQNRLDNLQPYTSYRKYVSLSVPSTFEDVSSDPQVAAFLKQHYATVNDIDYYIGLFAETPQADSPLPPLIFRMVAVDAFSQALTNPLLSEHVFREETFSTPGWQAIQQTNRLSQLVERNSHTPKPSRPITMTQPGWKHS